MSRFPRIAIVPILLTFAIGAQSKPQTQGVEIATDNVYMDRVGDVDGAAPRVNKASIDTIWIAEWTFDGAGGACDDTGWTTVDNRILNDGEVHWSVDTRFDGTGGISNNAAVCGYGDPCSSAFCEQAEGYANDWYQAIRIEYSGSGTLSFDYLVDSEPGYDFLYVELDSACTSHDRVNYDTNPMQTADELRELVYTDDGLNLGGHVADLAITDFGTSEPHCIYIAFLSDVGWSPCDGLQPSNIGAGLVVDNIDLAGVDAPVHEDFAGELNPDVVFANIRDSKPFGSWARLYKHVTDNDYCTENTTCAWLMSDDKTPTIANDPTMAFGPSGFVIRNWLDVSIVAPWVSLSSAPDAEGVVSRFEFYGGNAFGNSPITKSQQVRGKTAQGCVGPWGSGTLSLAAGFQWSSDVDDLSHFVKPNWEEAQVRVRVRDHQLTGWPAPSPFVPGPGPYLDRVRVGRIVRSGPWFVPAAVGSGGGIFSVGYAQDAFATEPHPFITPGTGEHFRPITDRFGTAAFSMSKDIGGEITPNLIPGDSIVVGVRDIRNTGGITSVDWYAAIVSGPHQGKAPPPWTVGANGFFQVLTDNVRQPDGTVIDDEWFVDLDDDYFRGGDVLHYFWMATDALGGKASDPGGLIDVPTSIEQAAAATDGLYEVSFLPTIDWDPAYVARIGADPHGKLEPTAEELAGSSQSSCILYVNVVNISRRRSGNSNRTSFMYTLDRLGYEGLYDVFDHLGVGNVANEVGGRATVEQAAGYSLIIHDGNNGFSLETSSNSKVDQREWYRDWLASAATSEAGAATLWLIGSRLAEVVLGNSALGTDMGVGLTIPDILPALGANPDVGGEASFTFANGTAVDFSGDEFTVQAACPNFPPYNGIGASGTAVVTHRWKKDTDLRDGAIIMNANPTQSWNTIMQAPTWREIREPNSTPSSPSAKEQLMTSILNGALPPDCIQSPNPSTDVRDDKDELDALPKVTALHQNVPNPFNPVTTIHFDLARDGHVDLRIYDVTGRLVRKLADGVMQRKRHQVVWDGSDDARVPVSSGIYFYRLTTTDFSDMHKMVVLR